LKKNYEELITDKKLPGHDDGLYVFNGLRTLAFLWVVYGHNWTYAGQLTKKPLNEEIIVY
jgi:hypothetical protein